MVRHKIINVVRSLLYGLLTILNVSCNESVNDYPISDADPIDSIVVRTIAGLNMSFGDTLKVDMTIYPTTAVLNEEMVAKHQLFLLRHEFGGGKTESSAYKIVGLEIISNKKNEYRIFVADTNSGYGYRDSVSVCYQKTNEVVESNVFEIKNAGSSLLSFSLKDGVTEWESFDTKNDTLMIQVPNSFNLKKATVCFKHNGIGVFLDGERQISGEGTYDFTDFCNPYEYVVKGFDGEEHKYVIEVFNLPILFVNTPDSIVISSRYEWIGNCSFIIRDTDGTIEDYGETNVKGRGNWSWREGLRTGKKPYAIKLANKPKDRTVLGMPGHKRWVLLSNPASFLPNPVGFEVNRRVETCKWAPRSRFVELILNGDYQGLYLLCEQIRIDKNRIDIKEMKETDIDGNSITGGYLISYDDAKEDNDPMYYSMYYNMPFLVKNPDSDDIQPQQLDYIRNYINEAEMSLYNNERFLEKDFYNYFDVDSWIDYYFVAELWGAYEMYRPRSIWLYKNRDGKLTAGPLWDLDGNYFDKKQLYCNTSLYYGQLLQSPEVVSRMKTKWPHFYSNIIGNDNYGSIIEYVDSLYETCHYSADRDRKMIPETFGVGHLPFEESKIDYEYQTIRDSILVKLDWLEKQIMSW